MYDMKEAAREQIIRDNEYTIMGSDVDLRLIHHAIDNAARAGVGDIIQWEQKDIAAQEPRDGMIVTNPPYGKRLDTDDLADTYKTLIALMEHEQTRG